MNRIKGDARCEREREKLPLEARTDSATARKRRLYLLEVFDGRLKEERMEGALALDGCEPPDWMKWCFVKQPFVVHFLHWFLNRANYHFIFLIFFFTAEFLPFLIK